MLTVTANHVAYQGGGETLLFPIPFPFLHSSHIRARLRLENGEEKALTPGVDYRIDPVGESGEITLLKGPLTTGTVLTVYREVPLTQETIYHNQGPNSPKATEDSLDKLTMISQQLQAGLEKAFVLPDHLDPVQAVATLAESPQVQQQLRSDINQLDSAVESARTALNRRLDTVESDLHAEVSETAEQWQTALSRSKQELAGQISITAAAIRTDFGHADQALRSDLESVRQLTDRIEPLQQAVAGKADSNDPRFVDARKPTSHAASHGAGGADAITPQALGCLPRPPDDGKTYVASSGGWVEHVDGAGDPGEGGGGTEYHTSLLQRDFPNQHPQSAITGLVDDMEAVRNSIALLGEEVETAADHANLRNRDIADQHPQTAISGLATDLAAIREAITVLEQRRVVLDHHELTGRDAADQHPQSAITGLSEALGNLQSRIATFSEVIAESPSQDNHLIGKGYADNLVAQLRAALAQPAFAPGPPADGIAYGWKDGVWVAVNEGGGSGGGSGGAGLYVPEFRLFMQGRDELPWGWYYPSGEMVPLASALGQALAGLSASIKTNWGVVQNGDLISLFSPDRFFAGDRGRFIRFADGTVRAPGSIEGDAIRNISGEASGASITGLIRYAAGDTSSGVAEGAFGVGENELTTSVSSASKKGRSLIFDASRQVPTADENRPCNVGLTPAVYLGVGD